MRVIPAGVKLVNLDDSDTLRDRIINVQNTIVDNNFDKTLVMYRVDEKKKEDTATSFLKDGQLTTLQTIE